MRCFPKHPQAAMAVWLANRLAGAPPDVITRVLAMSECPRKLFVLAASLRAATEPSFAIRKEAQ